MLHLGSPQSSSGRQRLSNHRFATPKDDCEPRDPRRIAPSRRVRRGPRLAGPPQRHKLIQGPPCEEPARLWCPVGEAGEGARMVQGLGLGRLTYRTPARLRVVPGRVPEPLQPRAGPAREDLEEEQGRAHLGGGAHRRERGPEGSEEADLRRASEGGQQARLRPQDQVRAEEGR